MGLYFPKGYRRTIPYQGALAAAVAARRGYPTSSRPCQGIPRWDAHGLRMEMVFYAPST